MPTPLLMRELVLDAEEIEISDFIFKVDTSKSGIALKSFQLPLVSTGTYDCVVFWGDGSSDVITAYNQAEKTHVYSSGGVYTIEIKGICEGFVFRNLGDCQKLLDILQWGTQFKLGTNEGLYFYGCENLNISATNLLNVEGLTSLAGAFANCYVFNSTLDWLDTSNVVDMNSIFQSCHAFNKSVSNLKTSNVTNMSSMFYDCSVFDKSVSNLDTGKVTNMNLMFRDASNFDQDLSNFNITALTTASGMLQNSAFSNSNYDLLLTSWESQTEKHNVTFHAGTAKCSSGAPATARANLVANGWDITDGGLEV